MAKKQGNRRPVRVAGEEQKKLILQRSGGHKRENGFGGACYQYQKEALKRLANRGIPIGRDRADGHIIYRPCSVSYYLNWLLWKDDL